MVEVEEGFEGRFREGRRSGLVSEGTVEGLDFLLMEKVDGPRIPDSVSGGKIQGSLIRKQYLL